MFKHILFCCLALSVLCLAPIQAMAQHMAQTPPPASDQTKGQTEGQTPAQAPAQAAPAPPEPVVDGATLDAPHTSATFSIRHILAPVPGRFGDVSGTMAIPAHAPQTGRATLTIRTDSIDTGVAARDAHLRSADFFEVKTYPTMTFVSERITPSGKDTYNVTGKLTIKDVSKTVTIPVHYLGKKPHPAMPCVDVAGYEASLTLNRLEYHVGTGKFFKMGMLGDTVDIRLAGEVLSPRPNCVKEPKMQTP